MANHVYFTITVDGLEDGCKAWDKAFPMETHERKMWNSDETYEVKELIELHKLPMFAHMNLEYDEDGWLKDSYNWYCNNIGAKWCNVEDVGDNYIYGYSAWCHPVPFVERMVEYFAEVTGNNIYATMTYEDEFRNFIGVDKFESYSEETGGEVEYFCSHSEEYVDCDDFQAKIKEKFPKFDDEDFDWDEPNEEFEGYTAQEYADNLVHDLWERGYWEYD